MESMQLKVGDAELECFSHGTAAGIILVPGGSLTADYLSGLADALAAAGFRAMVDIPGAGHLQPIEAPGPVAEAIIAFAR